MKFQLRAECGEAKGVRWHIAPEAAWEALCQVGLSPTAWTRPLTSLPMLRADQDEICFTCLAVHREEAGRRAAECLREAG
jgi:hypothetical protein